LVFGTSGNTGGAAFVIPDGTFTSAPSIYNLTINRDNSLTLNNQMISVGGILLCNGPLITGGNLTLMSDATGTALVDGSGTGSISGIVNMQRYLSAAFGYKYFSSPFQAATVSEFADYTDLTSWFPTFYRYDESRTSSGWVDYSDPAGILSPMHGYSVNLGGVSAPDTIEISGELNNGPISLTLYNNNNTYTQGNNLVGNPYPSAIDWDAVSGWTKSNIDNAIYYFNASAMDEYSGTYSSYVNGISSDGVASNIIPSMQGFLIHVSDGAYPVTGTLGMNNSVRINDKTQYFAKSARAKAGSTLPLIRMSCEFSDDSLSQDPFVLYMDDRASLKFDPELDALKFLNTNYAVPNLYAVLEGGKLLSINAISTVVENKTQIPLGLKTNRPGELVFNLTDLESYFSHFDLYFFDALENVRIKLSEDFEYKIELDAGQYHERFFLELTDLSVGVESSTVNEEIFEAFVLNGLIKAKIFDQAGAGGILFLHSIDGRLILRKEIQTPGEYEIFSPSTQGIYIISYISGRNAKSVKLFIGN
jgi:hypothetical protein